MTPEEIKTLQGQVTKAQAKELMEVLEKILPPHKEIRSQYEQDIKLKEPPDRIIRLLLGSAYDWFAFGN